MIFTIHVLLSVLSMTQMSGQSVQATAPTPQHSDLPASPAKPPSQVDGKDIIVVGTRSGPYPVAVDTSSNVDLRVTGRQAADDAHFFSRCVKPFDNGSLHDLIDGQPNRQIRAAALNRIIHGYMACYRGYGSGSRDYGTCNARETGNPFVSLCQSFYDRGALVEKVLAMYAPSLVFTTDDLFQPPVLKRFRAREDQFNKTRSKGERIFAEFTGCVVAIHPSLALAMLKSEISSPAEDKIRLAMLGSSEPCLKGAKRVEVDPSQFRVFVADAVYSWSAAFAGKRSLIPFNAKSSFLP